MSHENKALSRRLIEDVWNKGNLTVIDELTADNYVSHDPSAPEIRGRDGFKQLISMYRTAFPDIRFSIEDQIAEGDKVMTRWSARGTHKGALMGSPPTGKQATVTGITITRIVGGKAVEAWTNWDTLGLMQQLGLAPVPGQVSRA